MELCNGGELFDRILEEAEKHEGAARAARAPSGPHKGPIRAPSGHHQGPIRAPSGHHKGTIYSCCNMCKQVRHVTSRFAPPTGNDAARAFDERGAAAWAFSQLREVDDIDVLNLENFWQCFGSGSQASRKQGDIYAADPRGNELPEIYVYLVTVALVLPFLVPFRPNPFC